jgi:hypothetical protein
MSKRKDKGKLRRKLLELSRPNDFFEIAKGSLYFQKSMNKYKKSNRQNIIYPDINSLISDYRTEKIKTFTDNEVIKDELGDDIRKFKALQSITHPSRLSIKNADNSNKNVVSKIKENRKSLIVTLQAFERKGQFLIPENKKHILTSDLNPNKILYHKKTILELKKRRKETLTDTHTSFENYDIDTKNSLNSLNILPHQIDNMAIDLINDSENLQTNYTKNFKHFSNKFDEWKTIQEFKYPEFKQKYNNPKEV